MNIGFPRLLLNRTSFTKSTYCLFVQRRNFNGSFVLWRNRRPKMAPKQVEDIYKKVSQLEHILLRPDTYIGSVEYSDKAPMWIYDAAQDKILLREISYVPGLYKIFDEVLVNAADNKQRDSRMSVIKVNIDKERNEISVYNNGKGIPIVMHKTENVYVPEMIFGTLLTSSNYDDDERKVTGGRNGYGAKLCNIFSTKFIVETQDGKKHFKQTWMTELDDDIIGLLSRRAYDVAGSVTGIKVFLNNQQLPCKGFKQYVEQYTKNVEYDGEQCVVAFDKPHDRWDVALTVSDKGFQQVSFVNSIATTKGGRHVDYIVDQIIASLIETVKKKIGKGGVTIKPFQLKNHLWVFVNALIENPAFDSQTKEMLNTQAKDFGSNFKLNEKFLKEIVNKCGIVDAVMNWVKFKQMEQQDKKCSAKKTSKLKGVPKLEDANNAGTKLSHRCTLILTEGDSAKSLAVAGLGVIGRDNYGVFPLRGKMLNVRECTHKQIIDNAEINALLRILGLQYKMKYTTEEEMKTLRYGKIMIMTDQDQDGSHIKGLVINFIHHNWPHLLRNNFLEEFITPIVKATKGTESKSFYSLPEYMEWRQNTENWKSYKIKYYKGLGTSSAKEAKEYFSNLDIHQIRFKYTGENDDNAVDLAFSKKRIEDRKTWLSQWMAVRKERRERGEFEDYLYETGTRSINFSDFINKELVLFSNTDNERSIPSLVDGLKPGQRKVMFTCFKRADKKEVKVAQLAGAVGEMSAYHHGEQSLMATIINLAQDYVGSNNINLLLPNGQFGTRLQGGKDAASARYIFTQLNPVTKSLFPSADENVLRFLYEENQRIEPEWYCPVIPLVLVNGAEGIGTGWSTKIPNYNPRDVVANIRRLINEQEQKPLVPWFMKFKGSITKLDDTRFVCSGEVATLSEDTIEITELPIKTWTQTYKENVLEPMLEGTTEKPATITDFKEYHTEETVKFVVKMKPEQLSRYEREGLHKAFKLQTVINTSSMVLFDADGCLRKFNTPEEICQEFFTTRKEIYIKRKAFLEGMLQAQSDRLSEQARFIMMKINNKIQIENKRKAVIIDQLIENKFRPDPVKVWKELQRKKELEMCGEAANDEDEEAEVDDADKRVSNFDYLVGMAIWKLSVEDKDKMMRESDAKKAELATLEGKSWSDLWEEDLEAFNKALVEKEAKDEKDLNDCLRKAGEKLAKGSGDKARKDKRMSKGMVDVMPSRDALRVVPTLDFMKEKYAEKPKRDPNAPKKERKPREPKEGKQPRKKKTEANGSINADDDESTQMTNATDDSPKSSQKRKAEKKTKEPKEKAAKRPAASKSTPKKKKAKQEWNSDASEASMSESDVDDDEFDEPPPKREVTSKRAAASKATYKVEDSDDSVASIDSDAEIAPKPKLSEANGSMDDFIVRNGDEGSSQMTNGTDDSPKENRKRKAEKETKKPKEKAVKKSPKKPAASKSEPKKKAAPKKKANDWNSDASEASMSNDGASDSEFDEPPPKRETTSKRAATSKKPAYKVEDDADSTGSDQEVMPKPKARRIIDSDGDESF
ncbi:DNA topoisomerase 2 [Aphelenchoides bicaudatus]|nr:DNA topoisomerase 2 [Aphelenchoides bicaudatus]